MQISILSHPITCLLVTSLLSSNWPVDKAIHAYSSVVATPHDALASQRSSQLCTQSVAHIPSTNRPMTIYPLTSCRSHCRRLIGAPPRPSPRSQSASSQRPALPPPAAQHPHFPTTCRPSYRHTSSRRESRTACSTHHHRIGSSDCRDRPQAQAAWRSTSSILTRDTSFDIDHDPHRSAELKDRSGISQCLYQVRSAISSSQPADRPARLTARDVLASIALAISACRITAIGTVTHPRRSAGQAQTAHQQKIGKTEAQWPADVDRDTHEHSSVLGMSAEVIDDVRQKDGLERGRRDMPRRGKSETIAKVIKAVTHPTERAEGAGGGGWWRGFPADGAGKGTTSQCRD